MYILEFKKMPNEDCARKPILLSEEGAKSVALQLKDKNKHIERLDENGDFVELIDKYRISGIKKAGINSTIGEGFAKFMVCEYGGRHKHLEKKGFETCNCKDEFQGVPHFVFWKHLEKKYPHVQYSTDITPSMRVIMRRYFDDLKK
ncbi:MAG: hypothetical protein GWP15_03120 [Nitrospirae bacterium]|nr:hypothetical protein [Nitrospirota bacterium]